MEKVLGLEDLPNPAFILTEKEIRVLYEFLLHEYISYENLELLEFVRSLGKIVDELDSETSRPT